MKAKELECAHTALFQWNWVALTQVIVRNTLRSKTKAEGKNKTAELACKK